MDADWEATHKADPDFIAGAVYDADPNLPAIDGHSGARFTEVDHTGGRVLLLTMNQYPGSNTDVALAAAESILPGDAKVIWAQEKDVCKQYQFQSATLAQVLGPLDPQGGVLVELRSFTNGAFSYSATDVTEAVMADVFDATADTSSGC